MNLTQVMAAAAVGTIVTIGAALVLTQNVKVQARSSLQTDLDQSHLVSMMMLKNQRLVAETIGILDPSVAGQPSKFKLAPAFEACFARKGVSCSENPVLKEYQTPKEVSFNLDHSCTGDRCKVTHKVFVKIPCNSNACFGIQISTTTALEAQGGQVQLVQKKSDFSMPAVMLASKANLQYLCAQNGNKIMSGIDWTTSDALCDFGGSYACSNQIPLATINTLVGAGDLTSQCQKTEDKACADGIGGVGAFLNDSTCKNFASVVTPPPETPPNGLPTPTPVPPTNIDCVLDKPVTGSWSAWSQPTDIAIDTSIGCGFRTRTWTKAILQPKVGSGLPCGPTVQNPAEVDSKACLVIPPKCVLSTAVNVGTAEWYPDPLKTCGEKRQNWKKTATPSPAGTVACNDVTGFDVVDSAACTPGPCEFTWGAWAPTTDWSDKIDLCGTRTLERTATITKWGDACPVPSVESKEESKLCPKVDCVLEPKCTPTPAGSWSKSFSYQGNTVGCGTRPLACVTAVKTPERNGGTCPSVADRTVTSTETLACSPTVNCVGSWSACDCKTQTVTYTVTTPADGYQPAKCLAADTVTELNTGDQRACTPTELADNKCTSGNSCDVGGGSFDYGKTWGNFIWTNGMNSTTGYNWIWNPSGYPTDQSGMLMKCAVSSSYKKLNNNETAVYSDTNNRDVNGNMVPGGTTGAVEFKCVNGNVEVANASCSTQYVWREATGVSNITTNSVTAFTSCYGGLRAGRWSVYEVDGVYPPCLDGFTVIYPDFGTSAATCGPANNKKSPKEPPYDQVCGAGSSLLRLLDMGKNWAWVCVAWGGKPVNCFAGK